MLSSLRNAFCKLFLCNLALAATCSADDWPQWRGIARDGNWNETGIRDDLPVGQLPLDWSVEIGPDYTGPTVSEGRVYVMDRLAEDRIATERVWMFNERGELLIAKPSKDGLNIIDRCQLIEPTKVQLGQRGGVCWSHPAYAEKSVFARNDRKLVRASLAK